jgi:hypothetical protein
MINKDIKDVKEKSPVNNSPRPICPVIPSVARNKSVENFLKYQWSWTL